MSNTSDALADHDTYGKNLPVYKGIFASNNAIADAMGYTALGATIREAIWDAMEAAEAAGGVQDIANPADLPANQHEGFWLFEANSDHVELTQAEANASFSAKVAHAFYLEAHRTYPWSILGYTLEQCEGLFDPAEIYWDWNTAGYTGVRLDPAYAELQSICDHSPKRAYDEAVSILSAPVNMLDGITQLMWEGTSFGHSSSAQGTLFTVTDMVFTATTPPNVQITSVLGGLPAMSVDDLFCVKNHATHDGTYKVVTVNASTSDYIVQSLSGATGNGSEESADIRYGNGVWPGGHSANCVTMDQCRASGGQASGNEFSATPGTYISRGGCHFMAQWQSMLARSVNIPAKDIHALLSTGPNEPAEGRKGVFGHHSHWYPGVRKRAPFNFADYLDDDPSDGFFIPHGDDPYTIDNASWVPGQSNKQKVIALGFNYSLLAKYSIGQSAPTRNEVMKRALSQVGVSGSRYPEKDTVGRTAVAATRTHGKLKQYWDLWNVDQQTHIEGIWRDIDARKGLRRKDYNRVWFVNRSPRYTYVTIFPGSRTVDVPAGVQDGDLLVFLHAHDGTQTSSAAVPTGFTEIAESPFSTCGTVGVNIAYRYASSEPATYEMSAPPLHTIHGGYILAFRNVHPTTPFAEVTASCDTTGGNPVVMPSLSATGLDEFFGLWVAAKDGSDLELGANAASRPSWANSSIDNGDDKLQKSFNQHGVAPDVGWSLLSGCGLVSSAMAGQPMHLAAEATRGTEGTACISMIIQPPEAT